MYQVEQETFGEPSTELPAASLKLCFMGILVSMAGAYIIWGWGGVFLTIGVLLIMGGAALFASRRLTRMVADVRKLPDFRNKTVH
jgi:hypothetical protein